MGRRDSLLREHRLTAMTCSDFIDGFSEFYDGVASPVFTVGAEAHLASCPGCQRYVEVYENGRTLLRSFSRVDVGDDFHPRLEHRIYHLADERAAGRASSSSGTTAATALGMAVLLVFAAWSPALLRDGPHVELAPIVVSRPEARPLGLQAGFLPRGALELTPIPDDFSQDWSFDLLFQHSLLNERARRARIRLADLQ